jgi:hypothetical protein
LLLGWLRLFDVHPRAEIQQGLKQLAEAGHGLDRDENILGGYAYLMMIRKADTARDRQPE